VQGKIQLPDNVDLLRQLRNLREVKTPDGRVDVQPTGGMKDDKAVGLALAANEISRRPETLPPPQLGLVEKRPASSFRSTPGFCPVEAVCLNHPRCVDHNRCYGYANERVRPLIRIRD
jgi:hypothetical protein